mmetsp:Transcript_111678/g.320862  ORF Transcript_111678/g.320862 Transcript_111678/m.320862 type:complete len:235 (+) Transcript_111678:294-998(+)
MRIGVGPVEVLHRLRERVLVALHGRGVAEEVLGVAVGVVHPVDNPSEQDDVGHDVEGTHQQGGHHEGDDNRANHEQRHVVRPLAEVIHRDIGDRGDRDGCAHSGHEYHASGLEDLRDALEQEKRKIFPPLHLKHRARDAAEETHLAEFVHDELAGVVDGAARVQLEMLDRPVAVAPRLASDHHVHQFEKVDEQDLHDPPQEPHRDGADVHDVAELVVPAEACRDGFDADDGADV